MSEPGLRGSELLALADSLGRIERECRLARVALNVVVNELNRAAEKPSRWPDLRAPDPATLTHEVAIPEEIAEHIAGCGE